MILYTQIESFVVSLMSTLSQQTCNEAF